MADTNHGKTAVTYILVYLICLSAFLLLGNKLCQSQSSEQVTITTYYPAPYGVYTELRARRMGIGDTYFNPVSHGVPNGTLIVENAIGIGTDTPLGKFNVNMGANNNYFSVNNDVNIGVELRSGTSFGNPYIIFSNNAGSDYDVRAMLLGNDTFEWRGGVVRFTNADGTPAVIRTGEVWFCLNYADALP